MDRNCQYSRSGGQETASLSARRAWIEIASRWRVSGRTLSLSARRAWIEISRAASCQQRSHVALRKESVDRNFNAVQIVVVVVYVALRKESVDRNCTVCKVCLCQTVALRKESVDRNGRSWRKQSNHHKSLSARRAWIEIAMTGQISVSTVGRSPQGERG